jgi:hypothetical protein
MQSAFIPIHTARPEHPCLDQGYDYPQAGLSNIRAVHSSTIFRV